jgi:hypothetical protein
MAWKTKWLGWLSSLLFLLASGGNAADFSRIQPPPPPEISGGAAMSGYAQKAPLLGPAASAYWVTPLNSTFITGFLGFGFDDNATESGNYNIPPDPMGAAGTDRVIAVVNTMIEARSKSGTLLWRDSLRDFFNTTGPQGLGTGTFDPKVIWDHYENRFVVVTLEKTDTAFGGASNASRIWLAVSKTATPATATSADWYYHTINSMINISALDRWADYPGFAVDEEAVYITNNMFAFNAGGGGFGGVRLWIVNKGVSGGFYGGGAASWNVYNPYAGGGIATTTMPAQVFGASGVGSTVGTYLVSYSGLSGGGIESVQVVRVDNPLGAPSFTQQYLSVGDIENTAAAFPNAPQSGSANLISTGDRRALHAVWRDNALWMTTTVVPSSGADAGQATTHWFKLNAVGTNAITLADQGDIGGNDVAASTYTFFPSVAVNAAGDAMFGFAGSAATIFAGAYAAGRQASDAAGTVQPTTTVQAGLDYYYRAFGGTRNRWGDYSGIATDPTDYRFFWVFNEYAATRGTVLGSFPTEDGRWGTAWAKLFFTCDKSLSLTANQWYMIALPCEVTAPDNTVETVFGDDLPTANYGTRWRVYRRDAANNLYVQLNLGDTLQAGLGYWIKTLDGGTITVGSSTSAGNPQADVPLSSASTGRYNLVGHPFVFDVCWKDVQVMDGASVLSLDQADPLVVGNRACSILPNPDPSCVMSNTMHLWNGSAYQPYNGGTPGAEGVLSNFTGLWVKAFKTGIQLRVPVKRGTGNPSCTTVTGNGPISAQVSALQEEEADSPTSELLATTAAEPHITPQADKQRYPAPKTRRAEEWGLRLIVEADDLVDPGNLLGRLSDSVEGPDQHDLKELSPFDTSKFLTIVFPHSDWGAYAGDYTSDYRAVAKGGSSEWSFEVRSNQPRTITLSWAGPDDILRHSKLKDDETNKTFDPNPNNTYTVVMTKPVHRFRWRVNGGR